MRRLKYHFPILAAVAFGWFMGGFNLTSPAAAAGGIKVTLQSLKSQIDKILAGTLVVGAADSANHAVMADFADDADTLDGYDSSDFARADQVASWANLTGIPDSIADGDDIGQAGDGLQLNGTTFSVDFSNHATKDDVASLEADVNSLMTAISALQAQVQQLENASPD